MVDNSWDNSGLPAEKKRMGTGTKVVLGCGITVLVLMGTCVGGGLFLGRMIKKDPKGFEARMEAFGKGLMQKDWDRFRGTVDQLQTDEGAQALYRANPGLQQEHPTEAQFMETVRGWRPKLKPLPPEVPEGRRHRRHPKEETMPEAPPMEPSEPAPSLEINKIFGKTIVRYRYPGGPRLSATFDGERIKRLVVD